MKVRKAQRGDAIYVCTPKAGNCCCGHPKKGNRKIDWSRWLELWAAHPVSTYVPLVATKCLGPCKKANVLLLRCGGRSFWFRKLRKRHIAAVLDYAYAVGTGDAGAGDLQIGSRLFER